MQSIRTQSMKCINSQNLKDEHITIDLFNSTIITLNDENYSFPYIQNKTSNVRWIHVDGSDIGYFLQLSQQYDLLRAQVVVKNRKL